MNIGLTIKAIRELAHTFHDQTQIERLKTYSTIQTLLGEIKQHAKTEEEDGNEIPNVGLYLVELITPLRCLAGLEDYGHDDSQNVVWVLTGLDKLLSEHCFNIPKF